MLDPTDLSFQEPGRNYDAVLSYNVSKLAALLFTYELSRRVKMSTFGNVKAIACHPGFTNTRAESATSRLYKMFTMDCATGSLSLIFACVDQSVKNGSYIGPDSWFGTRGMPGKAISSLRSKRRDLQHRLWEETEKLTAVAFPVRAASERASSKRESSQLKSSKRESSKRQSSKRESSQLKSSKWESSKRESFKRQSSKRVSAERQKTRGQSVEAEGETLSGSSRRSSTRRSSKQIST